MSDSEHNMSEQEDVVSDESSMEEELKEQKHKQEGLVIQQQQNDKKCATYIFNNQDHTLGHSDVQFVGYSIPHPSQSKMNLRLQTLSQDTNDVLNQGLKTVQNLVNTIRTSFSSAIKLQKK